MLRRLFVALFIAIFGLVSVPVTVPHFGTEAVAQTKKAKRDNRSLLQRLFGAKPREEKPLFGGSKIRKFKPKPKRKGPAAVEAPAAALAEVQPKSPDARKVLVIGDFVAGGTAWGLDQNFANEPKIVIIDKSEADSGLVRVDQFDWNAELTKRLNEVQPDLVVVALGANDRQQMRDDNARSAIRSPGWEATYTQRITGMIDTLKLYGRPYFWVGAVPMRQTQASADMNYLNELFKPRVEAGGGYFVDVWSGFANEEGRYITSGPDVEGQTRQLRTGDGINFTRAGRLKLAFYVEREIRRQTGFGSGGIDLLATVTQGNQIEIGPDGTKRLVGPIISLNNPLPGMSGDLVGDAPPTAPTEESLQYKIIVKGEALPDVAGRVDDFAWPPRPPAVVIPAKAPEPLADAAGAPIPQARPEAVAN
jgi:hypothetical protein